MGRLLRRAGRKGFTKSEKKEKKKKMGQIMLPVYCSSVSKSFASVVYSSDR